MFEDIQKQVQQTIQQTASQAGAEAIKAAQTQATQAIPAIAEQVRKAAESEIPKLQQSLQPVIQDIGREAARGAIEGAQERLTTTAKNMKYALYFGGACVVGLIGVAVYTSSKNQPAAALALRSGLPVGDEYAHEVVWGLGADAGRKSLNGDVEGAFLEAVRTHGTRAFPASTVREDDPWFDEYFESFREGFDSSY